MLPFIAVAIAALTIRELFRSADPHRSYRTSAERSDSDEDDSNAGLDLSSLSSLSPMRFTPIPTFPIVTPRISLDDVYTGINTSTDRLARGIADTIYRDVKATLPPWYEVKVRVDLERG